MSESAHEFIYSLFFNSYIYGCLKYNLYLVNILVYSYVILATVECDSTHSKSHTGFEPVSRY